MTIPFASFPGTAVAHSARAAALHTAWGAAAFLSTLAVLILTSPATGQQPARGMESEDLHRLRSVTDVQLSPDGGLIAYVVSNREGPGRPYSQIWLMDVGTGQARRLGTEAETGSGPRWSPDGRWIAYFGRDGDRSGIVIRRPDGSGMRLVAEVRGSNHPVPGTGERLSWAPDSRRIAYLSSTPGPETEEAEGDPIVIRRYNYKTTGAGGDYFSDNRRLQIYMVEVETGRSTQLTDNHYQDHSLDWSPGGDEILFISNRELENDRNHNYDLFAVNVESGAERRLTALESMVYRARWSPDGSRIAYHGTTRGLTSSETTMEDTHVWTIDADGSNRRHLGQVIDNRQSAPQWSPDGQHLYFTVQERGNVSLYRLPVDGGEPEPMVAEAGRVLGFSPGANGEVAFTFAGPRDMAQLYRRDSGGAIHQLTDLNAELLAARQIAEVESFTFLSYDGLEVEAFLVKPLELREDRPRHHPLIVRIKGGPHGQRGVDFSLTPQVYAAHGYAVLKVNYRGSTGYGQAFADAIFRDQNGGEAQDVLYGMRTALARNPWLDPTRVGVEGGSYGGQLSMWLVTQTHEFAAAIPRAGISNLVSFNYLGYYHDYLAVEFGGFPHEPFSGRHHIMDELWYRSPLRYVAQVSTPVMLVHGMNDFNVVREESEQFFIALQDVGVETVLVLYPRAGHGIAETAQLVDLTDRSIAWYRKHFQGRGGSVADG